jgi:phenylalanyl-tRNA synthetase beta chain
MKFSYNFLQSYFKKKLPEATKLAQEIALHVFEIDGVEKKGGDYVIDVDILPNRPDCMSHIGLAWEIGAILREKVLMVPPKLKEDKKVKASDYIAVTSKDKKSNPRYCARVITGVKVGPSPKWLSDILETCGLRPINNIVDAANYVMLQYGQPLHCFDYEKIAGNGKKEIIVRFAQKGEKIACLDDKEYELNEKILLIADKDKPLAIAGIKGGKSAEIHNNTKTVVIESANFEQHLIRGASRALALRTDASSRFEHGLDPMFAETGANCLAELIIKIAGGKLASGLIDTAYAKEKKQIVRLPVDKVARVLGVDVPEKEIISSLGSLGFVCKKAKAGSLDVSVPFWRQDIEWPEDLIEEIVRIWGYEKIEPKFPKEILAPAHKIDKFVWPNILRQEMKALGWFESLNYSFVGEEDFSVWNLNKDNLVLLDNPMSSEFCAMRPKLIINLSKNIASNQANTENLRFYEIGKEFKKSGTSINPSQDEQLVFAGVCARDNAHDSFMEAKSALTAALEGLGITDIRYVVPKSCEAYLLENCAGVEAEGKNIGFVGLLNPDITKKLRINNFVSAFEVDMQAISAMADMDSQYEEISKFPSIVRDLSVVVPEQTYIDEVFSLIQEGANAFVKNVELFDIYEGEKNLPGKKSLSFHIVLQSKEKTLSSDDADNVINNIIAKLKSKGWEVKGAKM